MMTLALFLNIKVTIKSMVMTDMVKQPMIKKVPLM